MSRATNIEQLIEPLMAGTPYELVGVDISHGGNTSVLRVYVDKDGGINIDDIAKLSRQIGAELDVEGPLVGKYMLEVSSPGLDRPLYKLKHYECQIGNKLNIHLGLPIDGRKNFKGVLQKLEGENIHLLVDDETIVLSFNDIDKARVIPDIKIGAGK